MVGIYKITNPNGRVYVGQSTNIPLRWSKYKKLYCKDQPSLYSSLKKHGIENHKFEIIEECSANELDNQEIYWGKYFDVLSNKHLNNRLGRGFGSYDSEETKLKKRECHKGRSNYWLKDKPLSSEHKQKISEAKTGHSMFNEEWRENHKNGMEKRIYKHTPQHTQSIVKAKNKPVIQYTKDGIFIKEWRSGKYASNSLNICQPNINSCCHGKVKSAGGFSWKFKEEKL